jgi:hypothetical protein
MMDFTSPQALAADLRQARYDLEQCEDANRGLHQEIERLRAALIEIAAFKDQFANKGLRNIGSYAGFDEPISVKIAREALRDVATGAGE